MRREYTKPEITSSEAFTLTSQACDANQVPGWCDIKRNLLWGHAGGCAVVYKGIIPGEGCQPPPAGIVNLLS